MADLVGGAFNYGRAGFDAMCFSSSALPFLLWVALRQATPAIKPAEAAALITRENEAEVSRAVLAAMGFDVLAVRAAAQPPAADAPAQGEDQFDTSSR